MSRNCSPLLASLACALAAAGCTGTGSGPTGSRSSTVAGTPAGGKPVHCTRQERLSAQGDQPTISLHTGYSKVSLHRARARAPFPVLVPSDPKANRRNMIGSYLGSRLAPEGLSVQLEFPVPDKEACGVTRPHILLQESPWPPINATPGTNRVRHRPRSNHPTRFTCSVGGLTATCTVTRGPLVPFRNNPAGVALAIHGTAVGIYGGGDLGLLKRIGRTLVASSSSEAGNASSAG